ncbi:hypothetical protein PUNSTDRAFT_44051 [Punctularia strigosozonata HHB-11173 SS5]|uniref:uncharacterized protein n=1 Tax=Punctularia strigosozonata (strain HHB-11173) TaxID=741275 RepID=UPI0004417DD9|nr:uncharacterized protein PUNSTDRAFT_44051 [Punctularia strigosozonata HHB-11173 SS5]EIN09796.1 hypothetical protein PUNSTDRAFT_44051 [Punctularia strigosozonata HHB-11173 SS5]
MDGNSRPLRQQVTPANQRKGRTPKQSSETLPAGAGRILPPDLILEILRHLSGSAATAHSFGDWSMRASLASPALVCKEWYSLSLPILYGAPELYSVSKVELFARTHMMCLVHEVLASCPNVDALFIPDMRIPSPLPFPNAKAPYSVIPLRRITFYLAGSHGRAFAWGKHGLTSRSATTVVDLDLRNVEEIVIDYGWAYRDLHLPATPSLRVLRVISSTVETESSSRLETHPSNLQVLELRGNYVRSDDSYMHSIEAYAGTLCQLVLTGSHERAAALRLDFHKLTKLRRLGVGNFEKDTKPFDTLKVPPWLETLDVHWEYSDRLGRMWHTTASFFARADLMMTFIASDAYFHTSRRRGAEICAQILGQAPPSLARLCNDWSIPLSAAEPEALGPGSYQLFEDGIRAKAALNPFSWGMIQITKKL